MTIGEALKLRIGDTVKVRDINVSYFTKVYSINDWTKRIGVVDKFGQYAEYPYRNIVKKSKIYGSDEESDSDTIHCSNCGHSIKKVYYNKYSWR